MNSKITALILGILAAAPLTACNPLIDAGMEEPEVCITQPLHLPGAPIVGPQVTVTSSDRLTVPELPKQSGQTQLSETVKLTRGELIAVPGADLSFLNAFTITVSSMTQPLMTYQKQSAGRVTTVDLATNGADLASFFTGKDLEFSFAATGQIPQQSQTVKLKSCLYAKAQLGVN